MTTSVDNSRQIEARAAEWLAHRDSGDWGAAEEAALNEWLEEASLHVVAFVRLEAAWRQANRLKALSAGVPPGTVPSPDAWQLEPFASGEPQRRAPGGLGATPVFDEKAQQGVSPRVELTAHRDADRSSRTSFPRRWAVAATVVLAIGAGAVLYLRSTDATYRTPVGGLASVPMSDGSKVTLNTDSEIRLALSETERRVALERGEAFFEVAKDPNRPFVVEAGDKRVVAVGTQFSVRRDDDDVRVVITEGRVRIEEEADTAARESIPAEEPVVLSAGTIARASDAGILIQPQTAIEMEGHLSWRSGRLIFRDMALADAIAEFNRYNSRKIVIDDPAVAAIRLSGKFRATQFEAFVRLLEEGFPVRAERVGEQIVLTDRRTGAGTLTEK